MKMNDWKSLLSKFEIREGSIEPVQPRTLARYEKAKGLVLPKSYKEYCKTFGPGTFVTASDRQFCTPAAASPWFNLDVLNQKIQSMANVDEYAGDPKQFRRALYFGSDISTAFYFWDPQDVTDSKQNEFGVYVLYRDWSVTRLADTFWDLIYNIYATYESKIKGSSDDLGLVFVPGQ